MNNIIQFKEPDLKLPDDITEKKREAFYKKYSEFGEYFMIELNTETLTCRLLPRSEWGGTA